MSKAKPKKKPKMSPAAAFVAIEKHLRDLVPLLNAMDIDYSFSVRGPRSHRVIDMTMQRSDWARPRRRRKRSGR